MFDNKCYEVAEYFLPDGTKEEIKNELAQCIQDEIERWLSYFEKEERK